jgi:hypothetical protein
MDKNVSPYAAEVAFQARRPRVRYNRHPVFRGYFYHFYDVLSRLRVYDDTVGNSYEKLRIGNAPLQKLKGGYQGGNH